MDLDTYTMDQAIFIITLLVILIVIILKITIRYEKRSHMDFDTNQHNDIIQISTNIILRFSTSECGCR